MQGHRVRIAVSSPNVGEKDKIRRTNSILGTPHTRIKKKDHCTLGAASRLSPHQFQEEKGYDWSSRCSFISRIHMQHNRLSHSLWLVFLALKDPFQSLELLSKGVKSWICQQRSKLKEQSSGNMIPAQDVEKMWNGTSILWSCENTNVHYHITDNTI